MIIPNKPTNGVRVTGAFDERTGAAVGKGAAK